MALTIVAGLSQFVQVTAQALLQVVATAYVDETGATPTYVTTSGVAVNGIPITVDYPELLPGVTIPVPLLHIGVDTGTLWVPPNYGSMGLSDDGTMWNHYAQVRNGRIVITAYTVKDAQRHHLIDYLQWQILTAASTDPNIGIRTENYILERLRDHGIVPRMDALFDAVEFPPLLPNDPRPLGQAYRGVLKLAYTMEFTWQTPLVEPTIDVVIQPLTNLTLQIPTQDPSTVPPIAFTV